jgi:hypothetical protein
VPHSPDLASGVTKENARLIIDRAGVFDAPAQR